MGLKGRTEGVAEKPGALGPEESRGQPGVGNRLPGFGRKGTRPGPEDTPGSMISVGGRKTFLTAESPQTG